MTKDKDIGTRPSNLRPLGGGIKVYSEALLDDLLEDQRAPEPIHSSPEKDRAQNTIDDLQKKIKEGKGMTPEEKKALRYQQFCKEQAVKEQANRREIKEQLDLSRKLREDKFERNMKSVMDGRKLAAEIGEMLDLQSEEQNRKKKKEYDTWNEEVHMKIMNSILDSVKKRDYQEMNAKRNHYYQQFLDATNRKGAIFRDTIIESDYDPMEANREGIKIKTGKLFDPTSRVIDKEEEEKGLIDPKNRSRQPIGREVLDVRLWETGKIESTPHGHFAIMMSPESKKERKDPNLSRVQFDEYHIVRGKEVLDAEFPKGKRVNIDPVKTFEAMKVSSPSSSRLLPDVQQKQRNGL